MAASLPKLYDLTQVVLIVGGYTISGFGDGGAVEIAPVSAAAESSIGADGQATYSRTNDRRAKVTITVRQNSLAHRNLGTLFEAQQAAPRLLPSAFLLIDSATGERMSAAYFVFTERPTIAHGKAISDRVWVGELPNGFEAGNYVAGPLITN